jgi:citrate lyase subunit beta/citryl-CoA lyase
VRRRVKPIRSALFVPGNREDRMQKAAKYGADALILDLEDAVPLPEKERARSSVHKMIEELGKGGQTLFVRVNDLETGLTGADLEAIMSPYLYAVMLPKVSGPEDVRQVDTLLTFLERKNGLDAGSVLIDPLLETAQGLRQAYEVGVASPRIAYMGGITGRDGDIARAIGFQWTPEGLETLFYLSKVLLDARAAGVPYPMGGRGWWDIRDLDGLRVEAVKSKQLGYTGMLLIHPSHVPIVNEVFTPSKEEIAHWRALVAAMEECEREGRAVATHNGVMVDIAHVKAARDMLQWARDLGVMPLEE